MKFFSILCLLFLGLQLSSCAESYAATPPQAPFTQLVGTVSDDPALKDVEARITTAFNQTFMQQKVTPLTDLRAEVAAVKGKEYVRLVAYWTAYIDYQTSIYYLKFQDKDKSAAAAERGIATLESIKGKNAEELALQAYIRSFSIQFASGFGAARVSKKAGNEAEAALKLDPENLRANYVLGSLDFYTPAQYGGGKKAEGYLTKAISLPPSKLDNPYLPTWGKDQAYELLIRHYQKAEQKTDADRLLKEALAKYPNNYMLNSLAGQGKK